jgi:hypothetical protein
MEVVVLEGKIRDGWWEKAIFELSERITGCNESVEMGEESGKACNLAAQVSAVCKV